MSRIAVICGTGMSSFSTTLQATIPSTSTPILVDSTWGSVPIWIVTNEMGQVFIIDRHHSTDSSRTPPHEIEHRANVYAATSCSPNLIVGVNSVGSFIDSMPPGKVGIPSGILDLSIKPWTFHDDDAIHSDRTIPFDMHYSSVCESVLTESQGNCPTELVVAQCVGPQFESPTEIDALERLGAHVVGMTLGPEQRLISETSIPHVALSCSSNWAAGRTPGEPKAEINHDAVDKMASQMRQLISSCIIALLEEFN